MHANNEIGTVNDVAGIGEVTRNAGVLFHVDAAQSAGKIEIDMQQMKVDLLSMSGHKMYGPKGIGVLFVRRKPRVRLEAQMHGGGHERGLRSGTLNVPGVVGFGMAADLCRTEGESDRNRVSALRDRFEAALAAAISDMRILGAPGERLAGCSNLAFAEVEAESLIVALPEIALATGSACSSATLATSHVLRAMGLPREVADTSARFSLGRFTTEGEIDRAAQRLIEVIPRLRAMGPGRTTP
jgi:cysteine desulfurase